jgi:hypothetical protein
VTTQGTTSSATARIDHNTFNDPSTDGTFIGTFGNAPVLIDNNSFVACAACEIIHNMGVGISGWQDDVVPGSADMVFIEDNTFTNPSNFGVAAVQSYYGARTVFRHNTMNMAYVDQHGTCGNVYARWWEIYDNTFKNAGPGLSQYGNLRGGTGVIWGNTFSGNSSNAAFNLTEDTGNNGCGHIVAESVGGGYEPNTTSPTSSNRTHSPAYVWGNGSIPIQNGGGVTLNTDYLVSTSQQATLTRCESAADVAAGCPVSYNYVPYTYPHPLQGGGSAQAPTAPTDLTAAVQ